MRFTDVLVALATAGFLVGAQPHRHHHRHAEKRAPDVEVVTVAGPTVYAFEFDGQSMTQDQVCKGIADGSLMWAPGTGENPCSDAAVTHVTVSTSSTASVSTTSVSTTATPTSSASGNELLAEPTITSIVSSSTTSTSASVSSAIASTTSAAAAATSAAPVSKDSSSNDGSVDSQISSNPHVAKPFPDGQLDCSTFPEDYGAIPVDWMNMGGWSGLQYVQMNGNTVTSIVTGTAGSTCASNSDGTAMCSYACPPGYQKSQWPEQQGSTGQSVGGIMCGSDGKLHLTNPGLSSNLCIQGSGLVSVQNTLSTNVGICRTDYPGTEDEVVPLDTQGGSTNPLTCPEAKNYYLHEGSFTSAQYYVNPSGTLISEACQWSTNGTDVGNFAPSYIGVGTDENGKTWLSITSTQQQDPANYQPLDFSIELQGDFGGSNACHMTVKDGTAHYCSTGSPGNFDPSSCKTYIKCTGSNADTCEEAPGCTVEVMSGTATYILA
ncbi:hypothetical protein MMC32_000415 [Xylographa parallela]|nr:hypothetical protein [Xylographa parallela]